MTMPTSQGRPLPKFGEWDVKNPASADGFTVIFQRARNDKKTTDLGNQSAFRNANGGDGGHYGSDFKSGNNYHQYSRVASPKRVKKRWFFCGSF